MPIEHYLKSLMPNQEPLSETSFDVADLNTQEAILETHSIQSKLSDIDLEEEELPLEISLVVTLSPQKLADVKGDYSFSFHSKDVDFTTVTCAEIAGGMAGDCCASVDFLWQGEGSQKADNGLVEPLCEELQAHKQGGIHRKHFTLPPGDSFFSKEIYTNGGLWVYTCPLWEASKLEEHPVIPFGGFFHKGLDLDMMMPMYAFMSASDMTTEVVIKAQSYWQRAGVYPEKRGRISDRYYSLVPLVNPLVQTSLAQDVRGGKIHFGTSDALYVSYDYDLIDPETSTILLHLKQG